jgi:hypothetical protein
MDYANFLEYISPRIATFFTAMTPVGELRASIPVALGTYGMNPGAGIKILDEQIQTGKKVFRLAVRLYQKTPLKKI